MPSLSLCMIVRNAERDLPACLVSARGVVDEMVVADTGSDDETAVVARRHGARVISIPWEQDFAQARNLALEQVGTDWVLVLDADEQLDPNAVKAIPPLINSGEAGGYLVTIRNYVLDLNERIWDRPARPNDSPLAAAKKYPAYVDHENVRLFRKDRNIYFEGRVHETVGSRILACGMKLPRARFLIHHFGLAADAETREKKNRLYRDLGRRKVRDMPQSAQAHFELGLVELDNFDNTKEALECFEQACRLDPGLGVAWLFAALAQIRLGLFDKALESLKHAKSLGHSAALVAEMEGDAYYNLGRFDVASVCYRQAFRLERKSAALESKLGLAEVRRGKIESGVSHLRRAVAHQPELSEVHDRLILASVWLGRLKEAASAAEMKLETVAPRPDHFLRAASIQAQLGDQRKAEELLRRGLCHFPQAEKLLQGLKEVEFKCEATAEGEHSSLSSECR